MEELKITSSSSAKIDLYKGKYGDVESHKKVVGSYISQSRAIKSIKKLFVSLNINYNLFTEIEDCIIKATNISKVNMNDVCTIANEKGAFEAVKYIYEQTQIDKYKKIYNEVNERINEARILQDKNKK